MLLEKYKPETASQIVGNFLQVNAIRTFLKNWKRGKSLFLYGPTGSGKTLAVRLVAKDLGYQLIESYAGERKLRDKDSFISMTKQRSIIAQKKLLLVDEAEIIGSVKMLSELIRQSPVPVIIIGENPYDKKLFNIRKNFRIIKFQKPKTEEVSRFLSMVCEKENIKLEQRHISQLARMCNGDIRAALIDLEILKTPENKNLADIGHREQIDDIFNLLKLLFRARSIKSARDIFRRCDDPDKLLAWISENIINEFKEPEDIASIYNYLSRADMFHSRIIKRQAWGLQKYYYNIPIMGLAASKNYSYGFVRYNPPKFYYNINNMSLLEKISSRLHVSRTRSKEYIPLIKTLINRPEIAEKFGFDTSDIESLKLM